MFNFTKKTGMEKFIKFQGQKIYYKIAGEGMPLVLLHGFMEDMNMWDAHTESLSDYYQLIVIDLPGHGKSEVISEIHSMDMMADIVKLVLDKEEIENIVLIGHSMGGYATLAFAEKYPEYLLGFGLFHSHSLADNEEAKKNRERTIKIVEKERMSFINQFIPSLYSEENQEKLKSEIDHQIEMANQMNPKGITAALAGMKERPMRLDVLVFAEVPILFILGKEDSRIPVEKVLAQAATAHTTQINILGASGHMGWQEEPPKTIAAIDGFMKLCR